MQQLSRTQWCSLKKKGAFRPSFKGVIRLKSTRYFLALLAAVAILSLPASAQVLYGNLVGNVTDPQQASITDATVSVKSPSTGYTSETKTDSRGAYEVRNIPPGVYNVKIVGPAYVVRGEGIPVSANNISRVDAPRSSVTSPRR